MTVNFKFYKLKLIHKFLSESAKLRQQLLDELIIYATDPVRHPRRIRMLSQLSDYESQILKKIESFEPDVVEDLDLGILKKEMYEVCHRSA